MKKICALLLVLVTVFACAGACAEDILFQGLKWESHPKEFIKKLGNGTEVIENDVIGPRWEGVKTDMYFNLERENYMLTAWTDKPTGHTVAIENLYGSGLDICGHKFEKAKAYFRYAVDKEGNVIRDFKKSKMYMVRVEIVTGHPEEEYEDLKKKLAELYGEGKEKIEDISGKTTTSDGVSTPFERKLTRYTVQGSNKATILMETYTNNGVCYSLILYYVEKGADKRLDALVETMAKE